MERLSPDSNCRIFGEPFVRAEEVDIEASMVGASGFGYCVQARACQRISRRERESLASVWEVREVGRHKSFGAANRIRARQDEGGLWLSLVERCVRDAEAVGSNPTSPIFKRLLGSPVTDGIAHRVISHSCNCGKRDTLLALSHASASRRSLRQSHH